MFRKKSDEILYTTIIVNARNDLLAAFCFGLQKYLQEKKYKELDMVYIPGKDPALDAAVETFFIEAEYQSKQTAEGKIKWTNKK